MIGIRNRSVTTSVLVVGHCDWCGLFLETFGNNLGVLNAIDFRKPAVAAVPCISVFMKLLCMLSRALWCCYRKQFRITLLKCFELLHMIVNILRATHSSYLPPAVRVG